MKQAKWIWKAVVMAALLFSLPCFRVSAEADKTALSDAYQAVQTAITNEATYHDASFDAFETDYAALGGNAAVESLIADANAPQEAVDLMTGNLTDLLAHLILNATYVRVNALFWTTQAEDRSDYTLRSRAVYDAELDRLEAVLANPRSGEAAVLQVELDLTEALNLLERLADQDALQLRYDELQSIRWNDEDQYTPSSFALFETAFAALSTVMLPPANRTAFDIVHDVDVSVSEAALALAAMDDAASILVFRADKTELLNALEQADQTDLSDYTPLSIEAFEAELERIRVVATDPDASETEVDLAITEVEESYSLLVTLADKTALIALHAAVLVAFYEERGNYTPLSHEAFREAVLAYGHYFVVDDLVADPNVSQTAVDQLAALLQAALDQLIPRADIAPLTLRLNTLNALDLAPYTPSSIALFEVLLENVEAMLSNPNVLQDDVDQALAELADAESLLVLLADKTALQTAVSLAEAVSRVRYSESSIQTLDLWIETAQGVLADADAAQAAVDSLTTKLNEIRLTLHRAPETPSIRANGETLDLNEYVYLYEAVIVSYQSSDPTILTIDDDGIAQGLKFGTATVSIVLTNGAVESFDVLVRADVKPATIVLASLIPLFSAGVGYFLIFFRPSHFKFLKKIAFWTKKR